MQLCLMYLIPLTNLSALSLENILMVSVLCLGLPMRRAWLSSLRRRVRPPSFKMPSYCDTDARCSEVDAAKAASSETNQGVRPGEAVGVGALAGVPVGAIATSQAGPSNTFSQTKHATTHADHAAGGESVPEFIRQ